MSEYNFEAIYHKNRPIVKKLYDYPYKDIIEIIKLCLKEANIEDNYIWDIFNFEKLTVSKRSENDELEEIKIYYYDNITINCFAIGFEMEHGKSERLFDFATLEKVLNSYTSKIGE